MKSPVYEINYSQKKKEHQLEILYTVSFSRTLDLDSIGTQFTFLCHQKVARNTIFFFSKLKFDI